MILIDGQKVEGTLVSRYHSYHAPLVKDAGKWRLRSLPEPTDAGLHKRHGLQGPIDDALMEPFLIVKPTGKPLNEKVGAWASSECEHAITEWRRQFRGEARVKNDADVTDDDVKNFNLVCFGDPSSNKVLARLAGKLPAKWSADSVGVGDKAFPADHHALVLCYPNPLNPERYVVLNSGVTYREFDYTNNARQTPKLPDWAVIDTSTPATPRAPGGVPAAGFFDEHWQPKAEQPK